MIFDTFRYAVKLVLVATSIKQATCIKQTCIQFPRKENTLKCACIKGYSSKVYHPGGDGILKKF